MRHANEPHTSAFYQNMLIFSQRVELVWGNVWYVFFLHLKFQSEISGSPNAHLCKNTKIAWGDICLKSFGKIKNVASR